MSSLNRLFYITLVVLDVALAGCSGSGPSPPSEPAVASRLARAVNGGGQKSLYVNADLNANSPIQAYAILPAPTYLSYQQTSNTTGYGGVGLAIDTDSETLFVTFEGYGWLKIVDARTLVVPAASVPAPGASNLAGIVMDQEKQKLYTVDRSTNRLYVYTWNAVARTLTLDGMHNLPGVTQAYGIALDELRDQLYVADLAHTVKVFDTGTWTLAATVNVPSQTAMGVAVDEVRRFLYSGNAYDYVGCNGRLSQVNLDNGVERTFNVRAFTGVAGECVVGLAVDLDTGLVYITTGNQATGGSDKIMVFDTDLNYLYATGDIGSPTGLVVPRTAITYNPLNLTKSDGMTACVTPGAQLDYAIGYSNDNTWQVTGAAITDTLPPQVEFVSTTGGGVLSGSTVTWTLGTVAPGASGTLHLVVRVKDGVAPGAEINNLASIDCDQTGAAYANDRTDVCSNQPPVAIAKPDLATYECTSPAGALVTLDGTASYDPDPGDVLTYLWECITALDDPTSATPTGQFALGGHLACLTVTDTAGASSSDTAMFSVVDTTPPALVCPPNQVLNAGENCMAEFDPSAVASDVCDPQPLMTITPQMTTWPVGTTTVLVTAADRSGNAASCTSTVTVVDATPPVIACNAHDIFPASAPITFTATATDNCGEQTMAQVTGFDCWAINGAGSRHSKLESCVVSFHDGELTVHDSGGVGDHIDWTVTATDASGNTASETCSIVVHQPQMAERLNF